MPDSGFHRVGVIGGGQLAQMLALAGRRLGIEIIVQTPNSTDPAVAVSAGSVLAAIDDVPATRRLSTQVDRITFENEFVDLNGLRELEQSGIRFFPSLDTLQPLLDKFDQRAFLQQIGLPVPDFQAVLVTDPVAAAQSVVSFAAGSPIVLKVRRHGYDGQGTYVLKDPTVLTSLLPKLVGVPLIQEAWIPFERELAVMAARSVEGECVVYPVVETYQPDQICRQVIAPARLDPQTEAEIGEMARHLLDRLQAVGIFGIELFLTPSGQVLINEIAPRTHNSGHYTIEACVTSQFEQQLRVVEQMPLGDPSLRVPGALMVNLLGYETLSGDARTIYADQREQLTRIPHSSVHWYGKSSARPGRKLGHVTVLLQGLNAAERLQEAQAYTAQIETLWYGEVHYGQAKLRSDR